MDLTFTVAGGIAENHRQGDPPPFHEEIRRNQLAEVNHEQRAFLPLLPLLPFFPHSHLPVPFPRRYVFTNMSVRFIRNGASLAGLFDYID